MTAQSEQKKQNGMHVLFPTLIYQAWYPTFSAEQEKLAGFVRHLSEEDNEGKQMSAKEYKNGFTSYYSRNNLFTEQQLAGLVSFLQSSAAEFARLHNWDTENYQPVMNTLWANINSKFSFHAEHLHPYSHISGVFYVVCDAASPVISFKDPRPARWMMPPAADGSRAENTFHARVAPEAGKLLMFPSWLEHGVDQNQDGAERISMSFNFEMRPKDNT